MTLTSGKRFLFSVVVSRATGILVYSVGAKTEALALASLKAADANCTLVYDEMHIKEHGEPVFGGVDNRVERVNRNA